MGATMSPQIEVGKEIAGDSGPSNDADGTQKASRRRWLVLAICANRDCGLLVSGIWSRVKARRKLRSGDCRRWLSLRCRLYRQNKLLPPRRSSCLEMYNPSSLHRSMRGRMGI